MAPVTVTISRNCGSLKVAGMAYDVARVRGLHPSLGDGWVHFDAPTGMLIPDSVATTVSTAFRRSAASTVGARSPSGVVAPSASVVAFRPNFDYRRPAVSRSDRVRGDTVG